MLISANNPDRKSWLHKVFTDSAETRNRTQYKQFETDSIVYSLFNTSSNQSQNDGRQ